MLFRSCALGLLLFALDPSVGIICENPQLSYYSLLSVGSAAGAGEVHSVTRFAGEWNCKHFKKLVLRQGKLPRDCNRQFSKEYGYVTLGLILWDFHSAAGL